MVSVELPWYVCHKHVWALKIKKVIKKEDGSGVITPEENAYCEFTVSDAYMLKHNPEAGGYYVVYEDGYKSFSPASAFESGYTRV